MFFLISNQKVIHFKIRMLVPTVSKKRVLQLPLVWEKSLLFERQYGFHNKVSTNPALIDITSKIQTTYVTKEALLCGLYVDFKVKKPLILEFLLESIYAIICIRTPMVRIYLREQQQHTTIRSFPSKNAYQLWSPSASRGPHPTKGSVLDPHMVCREGIYLAPPFSDNAPSLGFPLLKNL